MIIGIGTDIIPVARIADVLERHGERFARRVFTESERAYCEAQANKNECYAARFAAKEAFAKAAGTGIMGDAVWQNIEIVRLASGAPTFEFHGVLSERFETCVAHLSLSHAGGHAVAFVVLERRFSG